MYTKLSHIGRRSDTSLPLSPFALKVSLVAESCELME